MKLPPPAREKLPLLLDPDKISHATGVEPARVAALLVGDSPDGGNSKGNSVPSDGPYLLVRGRVAV